MKAIRYAAVLMLTVAGLAAATTPAADKSVKGTVVMHEGGAPTPLCYPNPCDKSGTK